MDTIKGTPQENANDGEELRRALVEYMTRGHQLAESAPSFRDADLKAKVIFSLVSKFPDTSLPENVDVGQLTDRMVATIPLEQYWQEAVGPFYEAKGIAESLGISKQAVSAMERDGKLLGLRGRVGARVLYPSFQFSNQMETLPRLSEVMSAYGSDAETAWALATWLNLTSQRFAGKTAAEALREGNGDLVLDAIRADVGNRAA